MKKSPVFIAASLCLLPLCGCSSSPAAASPSATAAPSESAEPSFSAGIQVQEVQLESARGTMIPGTVVMPEGASDSPFVVLCHGHGGSRHENGGFDDIAEALAEQGIASIRVDYPGCGDSTEDFSENNMTNMINDTKSAIAYLEGNYSVSTSDYGIFGYSMGGRIALEMLADPDYSFSAAVMLAPAADTEDLKNLFGGAENWETLKADAEASPDKWVEFTTIYGQVQHLGVQFFADLEAKSFEDITDAAAAAYSGPSMVIYAVDDTAVSPSVSQGVAEKLGSEVVKTPEDGHSYGFYGGPAYVKRIVVENTADFFAAHLK
ncbi:MAG: alpha/beta fold hydrolase [Stecheria intestinalis]|nr:alpha/beta fold hydrolase [Stecheria intestinalis]MDY4681932.1 alpha/beta fold hydrolase [Lachnospiraceae bacterium]